MHQDILVDTNILLHAENKIEERQKSALDFVNALLLSTTHICVDEGFNSCEGRNSSLIGAEYLERLRGSTLGIHVIRHLALSFRVKEVTSTVSQDKKKKIEEQVKNLGTGRFCVWLAILST